MDNFLLRKDVPHTRYVDDFHIFCSSRKQAIEIRHALAEYLFDVHRLSLESSKSSVVYVDRFLQEELADPEEQEQQAKVDRLNELLEKVAEENGPYWYAEIDFDDDKELLSQAEKESFISLFESCVQKHPLHLGLARHLLRKALKGRTSVLNGLVFDNLQALSPALRDVVRYLAVTIPKAKARIRGQKILEFCRQDDVGALPFVRMWILELLFRRPDLCTAAEALEFAEESVSSLGIPPAALLAMAHNQVDWVRSRKEKWRNHEPWDRRALVWSASILPSGEKRPFFSMVAEQGDQLDAAVAKYLLSQ